MKQPALGIKINEIRNQKGITQKELSELCNIDIRTIQRIESGDVEPRMSTLKLISTSLGGELDLLINSNYTSGEDNTGKTLTFLFMVGVIYFVSWFLFTFILPGYHLPYLYIPTAVIYTLTGVLFYYGFYIIGKIQKNKMLLIASTIIMVCIPLFLIALLISSNSQSGFQYLNRAMVSIFGINSIIFGTSLLISKNPSNTLYKMAGVVQILVGPFFIFPLPMLNMIGSWLSVPSIILLLLIMFFEQRKAHKILSSTALL